LTGAFAATFAGAGIGAGFSVFGFAVVMVDPFFLKQYIQFI
jgi:hypothetical protein